MKKRSQITPKLKYITHEELGISRKDDILNELWSTNNTEASEGIAAWIKSPDCGRVAAEKILKACGDKLKNYE